MVGAARRRNARNRQGGQDGDSNATEPNVAARDQATAGPEVAGPEVEFSEEAGFVERTLKNASPKNPNERRVMELKGQYYSQYDVPGGFLPRGQDFVSVGRPVNLAVNSYNVTAFPTAKVYQYAIVIGKGDEKRGLIRRVWDSQKCREERMHRKDEPHALDETWVFDGNQLAWALTSLPLKKPEFSFIVDLDEEKGIPPRNGRDNKHRVQIKRTRVIEMSYLQNYLVGKVAFDSSVLECINFLDHLMRQNPSKTFTVVKRSYFMKGKERHPLGGGIEAFKGVYQSIRATQGGKLSINADVSNCTFWMSGNFMEIAGKMLKATNAKDLIEKLKPKRGEDGVLYASEHFLNLRRLFKLSICTTHRGREAERITYIIDKMSKLNAHEYKFDVRNNDGGPPSLNVPLEMYFRGKYHLRLMYPQLPLIQTTKRGVLLPMEVVNILPNQRYLWKLDEVQTSNMIKFAVTRPDQRKRDIQAGLDMLKWGQDNLLTAYGLKIQPSMVKTQARLLNAPTVQMGHGGKQPTPGLSGKWDLKNTKFYLPNTVILETWGIAILHGANMNRVGASIFAKELVRTYKRHGGRVASDNPFILENIPKGVSPGDVAQELLARTEKILGKRPQMLFFILPDKTQHVYAKIKKNTDCLIGILSQCVQAIHAAKCNPQYLSNLCMKINAKLGGTTSRIGTSPRGHFKVDSMVIGADVSHPAPNSLGPSSAAITVSQDKYAARFGALAQTNGHREEMITEDSMNYCLLPQVRHYITEVGRGDKPQHMYYFRDGVSEGQYKQVLDLEVNIIKRILGKEYSGWQPKFVVIICTKRHHIRFFPDEDKSAGPFNPHPGVLVDRDVTHPFENDAYLCSHSAIQGTARPTHYHVLLNEAKIPNNELYTMIYEQCYTFARSTTPVSLYPAVYYAHLASVRALTHHNIPTDRMPITSPVEPRIGDDKGEYPLIRIRNDWNLSKQMWYI